jgi:hypothetical protein
MLSHCEGKAMDSGAPDSLDWGLVALLAIIAAGLFWGLVFFLRHNQQDRKSLQEALNSDDDDDENST